MKAIKFVQGDATNPQTSEPAIIAHVCNDIGAWGSGFVMALTRRWEAPEASYRDWAGTRHRPGSDFLLGAVQLVDVRPQLWVANMIGQSGIGKVSGIPPVRYPAIGAALGRLAVHARHLGASVHMPRIGCGLAGGRWAEIGPLVEKNLCAEGISVTVYDLP